MFLENKTKNMHMIMYHPIEKSSHWEIIMLLSGIERSSWRDPLPEWGRGKISHGNWPPDFIHRKSRGNETISPIFPACSVSEMEESMSIWHFTSASFWQRVTTTAPFNDWLLRKPCVDGTIKIQRLTIGEVLKLLERCMLRVGHRIFHLGVAKPMGDTFAK